MFHRIAKGRLYSLTFLGFFAVMSGGFELPTASAQPKEEKDSKAQALELFNQSADLYAQGKFDEAAKLLEKAYALHPEPVLLYNLGRAYEGLGENQKAIDAYTHYLDQAPKAKDRGALERRIQTLKDQVAKEQKLEQEHAEAENKPETLPPAPQEKAPAPKPGGSAQLWPWVVTGVGAAIIGAGLFVGIQAKNKRNDAQDNPVNRDAQDQFDSAKSMASTANVLLIAGTLVTAGGITWAILSKPKRQPAEQSALTLTVTPVGFRLGGHL
jgi:tetratricopeptide (TPR) repeat protein